MTLKPKRDTDPLEGRKLSTTQHNTSTKELQEADTQQFLLMKYKK